MFIKIQVSEFTGRDNVVLNLAPGRYRGSLSVYGSVTEAAAWLSFDDPYNYDGAGFGGAEEPEVHDISDLRAAFPGVSTIEVDMQVGATRKILLNLSASPEDATATGVLCIFRVGD